MEKEITYLGIEKITYKFTGHEVLEALIREYHISIGADYDFFLNEGYEDALPYAKLIVRFPAIAE